MTDRSPQCEALSGWLERLYSHYHHRRYISPDPLEVLYVYPDPSDREIAGLVAALLAYGNVRTILGGVHDALDRLGPSPRAYLDSHSASAIRADFHTFRYRVTSSTEMAALLVGVKRVLAVWGRLETALADRLEPPGAASWLTAVNGWATEVAAASGRALDHLLPLPARGSACKRLNLYLRWMVRCDGIDPGGWHRIGPAHLIAPLDTHLHRVARTVGLTGRRTPDLRTAVDITARLVDLRPDDPLRYDFALTRPGIRRETPPGSSVPFDVLATPAAWR